MARVKGISEFVETTATLSIDPPLPPHAIGDFLLVFAVADGVANALTATGWTIGGQSVSPGATTSACRAAWIWKIAVSEDEALTIATTTTTTTWVVTSVCIEGAHASTPIDVSNGNGITVAANPGVAVPFQAASVTTTTPNCLVFWTMFNSISTPSPFPGVRTISSHDNASIGLGIGMLPISTASAAGTLDFYTEDHTLTTQNSVSFTIGIKDAAVPDKFPAYLQRSHASMLTPFRGIVASVRGESYNATNTNIYTNMPNLGLKQAKAVFQYDLSTTTFYDRTAAANNATTADFQLLNNSPVPAANDYIAWCMDAPFPSLTCKATITGAGGTSVWEVLNGATNTWVAITVGWNYFSGTTLTTITWPAMPTTQPVSMYLDPAFKRKILSIWKPGTLNGVTGYWMRNRWSTAPTTNPTLSFMVPSEGLAFYDAFANVADCGANPFHNVTSTTPTQYSATVPGLGGTYWNLGTGISVNPTNKMILGTWSFAQPRDYIDLGARSELGGQAIAFIDGLWRNRLYYIGGYAATDTYPNERNVYTIQWDQVTNKSYNVSSDAVTGISKVGLFGNEVRGAGVQYFSQCVAYEIPIMSGGTSATPIQKDEFLKTFAIDYYYPIPIIRNNICIVPIQIGGGDTVHVNLDTLLLSFPNITTEPDAFADPCYVSIHTDPNYLGFIFNGKAGDTIKLVNSVLYSNSPWRFEMNELCSSDASWDFTGTTLLKAKVSLRPVRSFDSMTFSECTQIDASECTLNNCKITAVPSTNDSFIVTAQG